MKVIESAGKTREEAIQNGLKELRVDMHDLEKIDVIDEGSKGFLGIGARPARVRLTVARSDEPRQRRDGGRKDRQERRDGKHQERHEQRNENRQKRQEQQRGNRQESGKGGGKSGGDSKQQQREERPAQPDKQEGGRRKKRRKRSGGGAPDNRQAEQKQPQQGNAHKASPIVGQKHKSVTDEATEALRRAERFENGGDDASIMGDELPSDARADEVIETITDEQGREAAAMLGEILGLMELNGKVTFSRVADGSARLAIESEDDGGILIGKRGVTLHAIQYLVNRMIAQNEAPDNTERVVVDVGGYVDRRQNTLADMARSMAKRAKDSGRNVRLKPLSPQERRIIHLTLEPDPQVRTYSLGDSLFRSIVINPVGGRSDAPNRRERSRDTGAAPANE